jgi:protein ImuB
MMSFFAATDGGLVSRSFWRNAVPVAKHILCIYLPHWPITRRYRRHREYRSAVAAVIVRSIGQRRMVIDISPKAVSKGIRIGMSDAEAHALCANLHRLDEDCAADQRALEALGRWLIRFTPVVSCGWDDMDANAHAIPAVLFLDLTGSERLFGGIDRLIDSIKLALAQFGIPARTALASTPGAAWAFASTGETGPKIASAASPFDALPPFDTLPVESLRLNDIILGDLHHLGLRHVGDVLRLPRDHLPSRFGPLLLKRLDQLTGVLIEPLTNLVNNPPITARMEFDAPIEALEDIWRIFERLLGLVIVDLIRRNHGARQLRMICTPDRGWGLPTIIRTIALSRPGRDRATLFNLIRHECERVNCDHGFVRFQLDVSLHEAISEAQTQLFDQQSAEEKLEFERLLQRLPPRLGETGVIWPLLVESYLPERAWRPAKEAAVAGVIVKRPPLRPLTLFSCPIEIRVVCEPSEDRTAPPRQFTWQGNVHRVAHAAGPERIAGEWWRGHRRTRDYYDTEDEAGRRFWLFRVMHIRGDEKIVARWFLHGRFD